MTRFFALLLALAVSAVPAAAEQFRAIKDQQAFVQTIEGKALTRFGIQLSVTPSGAIQGDAFGRSVTGQWQWSNDGYFCRDLFWGERDLGPNCQLVALNGNTIRFYADRGDGIYADFRLR